MDDGNNVLKLHTELEKDTSGFTDDVHQILLEQPGRLALTLAGKDFSFELAHEIARALKIGFNMQKPVTLNFAVPKQHVASNWRVSGS